MRNPRRQTLNLPEGFQSQFEAVLSDALAHSSQQSNPTQPNAESTWKGFKLAMQEAYQVLPEMPQNREPEWVTDELRNLTRKKCNAWLHLRDSQPPSDELKQQYQRLKKLTRLAAEKERNAWWSAHAVEAEKQASIHEQ